MELYNRITVTERDMIARGPRKSERDDAAENPGQGQGNCIGRTEQNVNQTY